MSLDHVRRYAAYIRNLLEKRLGLYRWEEQADGTVHATPLVPRQCSDIISFATSMDLTARREGGTVVLSGFGEAAGYVIGLYVGKMAVATDRFTDGLMTREAWRQLVRSYWNVCASYGIDCAVAALVDPLPLHVRQEMNRKKEG